MADPGSRGPDGVVFYVFLGVGELKKPKKQGRKPCQGGSEEPFSFHAKA